MSRTKGSKDRRETPKAFRQVKGSSSPKSLKIPVPSARPHNGQVPDLPGAGSAGSAGPAGESSGFQGGISEAPSLTGLCKRAYSRGRETRYEIRKNYLSSPFATGKRAARGDRVPRDGNRTSMGAPAAPPRPGRHTASPLRRDPPHGSCQPGGSRGRDVGG